MAGQQNLVEYNGYQFNEYSEIELDGTVVQDDAQQIKAHAAHLRARLEELRTHLGIQFPI
jgi:hypothetical protein